MSDRGRKRLLLEGKGGKSPVFSECLLGKPSRVFAMKLNWFRSRAPLRLKHNCFDGTLRETQQISVVEASATTELYSDGRQETASRPGVGGNQQLDQYRTSHTGSVHLFFMLYLLNF